MNLYLIAQDERTGYDTYDSAVVCAESEEAAKQISPSGGFETEWYGSWASSPDNVKVELIGEASLEYNTAMVICSSFNAG